MNIKNPQRRLARWITRLSAFDVEFVYRKGECNEVADCVSRNALAARLAKVKVIKHDGAHSGLNSAAREQTLARIRDLKKAETGGTVTQHHAEFKQLASQAIKVMSGCLRSLFTTRPPEPRAKRGRLAKLKRAMANS